MQNVIETSSNTNKLPSNNMTLSDMGMDGLLQSDIKLPRLLLMQAGSPQVQDESSGAKIGDIRDSVEFSLVGDKTKPVKIVPIFTNPTWRHAKKTGGEYKFTHMEPRKNGEWRDRNYKDRDGNDCIQEGSIILFALLYSDIKEGVVLPYEILLKNYSVKHAGNKLGQIAFSRLKPLNKAIFSIAYDLSVIQEENKEKKKFFCFDIKMARDSDNKVIELNTKEYEMAKEQAQFISQAYRENKIKAQDEEVSSTTTESIPF